MLHPARRWLLLAGGFALIVGALAVVGWVTNTKVLVQWAAASTPVKMNTALCLALCGAGAMALALAWRRVAAACGLVVTTLAAVVLAQFLLGRPLGVDELFWKHQWVTPPTPPGQMTPNTAAALTLVGGGIL